MDPHDEIGPWTTGDAEPRLQRATAGVPGRVRARTAGIFSEFVSEDDEERPWPEAARLREFAVALQNIFAQHEERNALCDEFLDLCTIHGESHPGERKLARAFLARIERGEVGSPTEEKRPW